MRPEAVPLTARRRPAPPKERYAVSKDNIGLVRSTPDALSFDQTAVSHLLQIVFDARR